jgi:hypothetical protein
MLDQSMIGHAPTVCHSARSVFRYLVGAGERQTEAIICRNLTAGAGVPA